MPAASPSRAPATAPSSPPAQLSAVPARLTETGLYADLRADALAPGVLPYRPQFELWSDGASKRRWISLPPGTRIDTSDMDSWQFPEGTKLWKEFSRDNVRSLAATALSPARCRRCRRSGSR